MIWPDAHPKLSKNLHIATLRNNGKTSWADGRPMANHGKVLIVDDFAYYVGSQNMYAANLAERRDRGQRGGDEALRVRVLCAGRGDVDEDAVRRRVLQVTPQAITLIVEPARIGGAAAAISWRVFSPSWRC